MKQAVIIRKDLKMSKGKIAAQSCHASLGAYKQANKIARRLWELSGEKIVILSCNSEEELLRISNECNNLPHYLVRDAGRTEVSPGTITALGIGPSRDAQINKVTSKLKLL